MNVLQQVAALKLLPVIKLDRAKDAARSLRLCVPASCPLQRSRSEPMLPQRPSRR